MRRVPERDEVLTVREATKLFPKLLDEPVRFGFMQPSTEPGDSVRVAMMKANEITFEFAANGYRTVTLTANKYKELRDAMLRSEDDERGVQSEA